MESEKKPEATPQRKRLPWFALGALVGVAVALLVPWVLQAAYGLNRNEKWQTTRDIDLSEAYFFAPEVQSPVKGTLLAGSLFTVNWLHGGAAYVRIEHVLNRRDFAQFARQLDQAEYNALLQRKPQ